MSDQPAAAPAVVTAPPPVTARDLQRAAMRDLVALAAECAATETRIDQKFHTTLDQAEKELTRAQWSAEQRFKTAVETARGEHARALAQIEQKHKADVAALENNVKLARQKIQVDAKSTETQIKQEFDQSVWLAESLYDGALAGIRDEFRRAKDQAVIQTQELDGLRVKADELLVLYNVQFLLDQRPADEAQVEQQAAEPVPGDDPKQRYETERWAVDKHLETLRELRVPRMFVGAKPYLLIILLLAAGAIIPLLPAILAHQPAESAWRESGMSLGGTVLGIGILWIILRIVARRHIAAVYLPLCTSIDNAKLAARDQLAVAADKQKEQATVVFEKRKGEETAAREKFTPLLGKAKQRRDESLEHVQHEYGALLPRIEQEREKALAEAEAAHKQEMADLEHRQERDREKIQQLHAHRLAENQKRYDDAKLSLAKRLADGLTHTQAPMTAAGTDGKPLDWNDPAWRTWTPPKTFPAGIRFGELTVDLKKIADSVPRTGELKLALPDAFAVPATLALPRQASMLIQTDRSGREPSLSALQMVMMRLLVSLPAGRVRFTLVDPVGLGQSFAGFMHLADHDDALVGGRIWTENDHIEQQLANLTEHMETVIQKYLRNEYETIDEYNAQAGELAEPYRFLVIADFPVNFTDEAIRRLASIASSGARCGVYTLVVRDLRESLPGGSHVDELVANSVNILWETDHFVWKDPTFQQFPLTLDAAPSEEVLTGVLDIVGRYAKEAKRVEVPFNTIAPAPDRIWSASSRDELQVPVGRMGATRLQMVRLGRGVAQHGLIAGKTGSGKSTLLHVLVTNLALWYSPDEVEFYLVDFKKGVEFKIYATGELPHARAIAVESDREFGLSVLQRIDAELARRGAMFRKLGVQDISSYRQASGEKMPRTLLIIDEFQEFFSEDDKLAQDAALLLDRLVRQGRAFGIHLLLGSQTIGGTSGLSRSTIGQMAVRIALQCSEADSQMILGDNNSAARLLSRPGEAIYNDAGGLVENNSPFQVSWLPDRQHEACLSDIRRRFNASGDGPPAAIVFEGNAPADISKNQQLAKMLAAAPGAHGASAPVAFLGEPVAIKDPTTVGFRRQSGANMLVIGQQEEQALAIVASSLVSLAAQHSPQSAQFVVFDGSPADSPLAAVLPRLAKVLPHPVKLVEYRAVPEAIAELAKLIPERQSSGDANPPAIYLMVYGLQRYRLLRKQEDAMSFSMTDEEKPPAPDKQFADLLREGPPLGIHTLAWIDTAAALDRTLDRNSMREFDNRILFQMGAADSSNLIDSPLANKLGFYRALAYSEEQGVMEKFRPYALPAQAWLEQVKRILAGRR